MKKFIVSCLLCGVLSAVAQTNSTYSKTNLDNMFATNRIKLGAGVGITVTTNSEWYYTISAPALAIGIQELAATNVVRPWIPPDIADVEHTNLCTWNVTTNGIYMVQFSEYTLATNNAADSVSLIYVIWTDPNTLKTNTTSLLNYDYNSRGVWTHYSPLSFNCKAGSSLIVSNWNLDSFDGADPSTTNYVQMSIWGPR